VRDREHWTFPDGIEKGIAAAYVLKGNGTCNRCNTDNGDY